MGVGPVLAKLFSSDIVVYLVVLMLSLFGEIVGTLLRDDGSKENIYMRNCTYEISAHR